MTRGRALYILSTALPEHHVQKVFILKLDDIKIFLKIYMTKLTVFRPNGAIWITVWKTYVTLFKPKAFFGKMYVTHKIL